ALRLVLTAAALFPRGTALFPGGRGVPAGFDAESVVEEGYEKTGGRSLPEIPFQLTFETDRFGEPYPAGAMGIALAIVIPLGLLLLARRGGTRGETLLALAVFAGSLAAWDLFFRGLRHGFPLLPLAGVIAA